MSKKKKYFLPITVTAILVVIALIAVSFFQGDSEGRSLEEQMWKDIQAHKWDSIESHIADYFQSVHADGGRNRAKEIELIKGLNIGDYTISNFSVTGTENLLIVTYYVSVNETIDNKDIPAEPTPRLSVWQKVDDKWQWVAHANLNKVR